MKYQFIRDHASRCSVTSMCRALHVSRSGFYDWYDRKPSARDQANDALLLQIRKIHRLSRENYGAVKTWEALNAAGHACGLNRVARLRCAHGIEAKRMRRFRSGNANRQTEGIAPNHLQRNFHAESPDRVWVGDCTFIPTREGWLYLAVLLDLFSRKVVGWSMGAQINRQLVIDALLMAIQQRDPAAGLIHHTDQGVIYGTSAYRAVLAAHGMIASMSRRGNCHDNAVAESFFSNLKNELTWHETFDTRAQARAAVFDYIELFYNRERIHQTLDYVSPVRYEERVDP
jgi:transposase InsO family protein